MRLCLTLVFCLSGLLLGQATADACSCPPPPSQQEPETCAPESERTLDIPDNHSGLLLGMWVEAPERDLLATYISLQRAMDGDVWEDVSFDLVSITDENRRREELYVVPEGGLSSGQRYVLALSIPGGELGRTCPLDHSTHATIVETPTENPTLSPGATRRGTISFDADSACSSEEPAVFNDVTVSWPHSLEAISDVIQTSVYVDGERYVHKTGACQQTRALTLSEPTFRLAASCGDHAYGLDEGTHQVIVRSSTREGYTWASDPVEVALWCEPLESPATSCSFGRANHGPNQPMWTFAILGILGALQRRRSRAARAAR